MGMKSKSGHFGSGSGGPSKREGGLKIKLNLQLFASNKPDAKMSKKGKRLYRAAKNQELKNQIAELYRPGAKVGDGGTADALREEIKTGKMVGGKGHYIKAKERASALRKLIKSGKLSKKDMKIAQMLLDDLEDALKGYNNDETKSN